MSLRNCIYNISIFISLKFWERINIRINLSDEKWWSYVDLVKTQRREKRTRGLSGASFQKAITSAHVHLLRSCVWDAAAPTLSASISLPPEHLHFHNDRGRTPEIPTFRDYSWWWVFLLADSKIHKKKYMQTHIKITFFLEVKKRVCNKIDMLKKSSIM